MITRFVVRRNSHLSVNRRIIFQILLVASPQEPRPSHDRGADLPSSIFENVFRYVLRDKDAAARKTEWSRHYGGKDDPSDPTSTDYRRVPLKRLDEKQVPSFS